MATHHEFCLLHTYYNERKRADRNTKSKMLTIDSPAASLGPANTIVNDELNLTIIKGVCVCQKEAERDAGLAGCPDCFVIALRKAKNRQRAMM